MQKKKWKEIKNKKKDCYFCPNCGYLDSNRDAFYGKQSNESNNVNLEKTITKLTDDLKINKDLLNKKEKQLNDLKLELQSKDSMIKSLNSQISEKIIELNNLKNQIKINNDDDLINQINPGEKVITTLIISTDQKVMYPIACKNTTPFIKVEEKLYEEYPEFKETENYYIFNGTKIKRFKTIEENKITKGSKIILCSENAENN